MLTVVHPCCSSGSLSHSECSSPSLITPPLSPLNLETSSFASSQSQSSISTLPRISVSPVPTGERRKDRYTPVASVPSCCAPPPPQTLHQVAKQQLALIHVQQPAKLRIPLSDKNNWSVHQYRIMYVEGSAVHITVAHCMRTYFNLHHHIKF